MNRNHGEHNCPVGTTIDLIGGKYKSLILWHLTDTTLRFGELRKLIPQATPKMLTQQLRELEESNLVIRVIYPVVPPKVEYSLTEFGKTLIPVISVLGNWGDQHEERLRNLIGKHSDMTSNESD